MFKYACFCFISIKSAICFRLKKRKKGAFRFSQKKLLVFINDKVYLSKAFAIALAAALPAPIAEITVAAPVTASPPA